SSSSSRIAGSSSPTSRSSLTWRRPLLLRGEGASSLPGLAARAPVELAPRGELHRNRRPTDSARLARAVIHPMPVGTVRERGRVRATTQPVHREHLTRVDADLEELDPVEPEPL